MLRVESGEALVERHETSSVVSCECHEIGVGDLSVSDHAGEVRGFKGQRVGPEGVPLLRSNCIKYRDCLDRCLPFAQEEPKECAFRYWAGSEVWLFLLEPGQRDRMMDVVDDGKRDEHIAVRQEPDHTSSSSERTSSVDIGRPTDICGMPRLVIAICGTFFPRPKRISSAITSLIDRFPSWASCRASSWRSCGRSIVVRINTS